MLLSSCNCVELAPDNPDRIDFLNGDEAEFSVIKVPFRNIDDTGEVMECKKEDFEVH